MNLENVMILLVSNAEITSGLLSREFKSHTPGILLHLRNSAPVQTINFDFGKKKRYVP